MGEIINVKEISSREKQILKDKIASHSQKGQRVPTLATILVGDDPGSAYYLNMQKKSLESLGGTFLKITLSKDISQSDLLQVIKDLNADDQVHGIMVLLPLPNHLSFREISFAIDPKKDVDGVNPLNIGLVASTKEGMAPCTPKSVVTILKETLHDLEGKKVVILGRSNIVGKPLVQLLLRENATVTVCHSKTKNLSKMASSAEILISAMGRPHMVDETFVAEGATVIDVGTSEKDGKIVGDLEFESVEGKAKYVTKVPGGVGTLTTTILMKNLLECYENSLL